MKILRLISFITIVSSQQLAPAFNHHKDSKTISYNSTLRCGECILGGFNFCYQGNQTLEKGQKLNSVCYQNEASDQQLDSSWSCSKDYSDQHHALTFCPQKKHHCGENHHDFKGEQNGTHKYFSLSKLKKGETCTFHLNSSSGSIAFAVHNNSKHHFGLVNVSYIEYSEKHLDKSKDGHRHLSEHSNSSNQDHLKHNFSNAGNQGLYIQKAPFRHFNNGSVLESVPLGRRYSVKKNFYSNETLRNHCNESQSQKDESQEKQQKNKTANDKKQSNKNNKTNERQNRNESQENEKNANKNASSKNQKNNMPNKNKNLTQNNNNQSWFNYNITGKVQDWYQEWFPKNTTNSNQSHFLEEEQNQTNLNNSHHGNDTHRKLEHDNEDQEQNWNQSRNFERRWNHSNNFSEIWNQSNNFSEIWNQSNNFSEIWNQSNSEKWNKSNSQKLKNFDNFSQRKNRPENLTGKRNNSGNFSENQKNQDNYSQKMNRSSNLSGKRNNSGNFSENQNNFDNFSQKMNRSSNLSGKRNNSGNFSENYKNFDNFSQKMNRSSNFSDKRNNSGNFSQKQNHSSNFSEKWNNGNIHKDCPMDQFTHAVLGYGLPTKGQYSLNRGGWKTFGTLGQGNSTLGVKDDLDNSNEHRHLYVTFTALHDFSDSDQIDFVAHNSQFVDDVAKQ